MRPLVKFLLSANALLELARTKEENIDASSMQCSHELGFQRSVFPLPSRQTPFEQRQQGCRSKHFGHDILAETTFYGIKTTIQSRTIRFVQKSTREVSVGWTVGDTGANGTNPIAPLRSRNTSFATLHSTQKSITHGSVRLGLVR